MNRSSPQNRRQARPWHRSRRAKNRPPSSRRFRPEVCQLEDRTAPSTGLYFNDFHTAVGEEWSVATRETSPFGQTFLGQFNNQTATLSLNNLPAATTEVTVSFKLFVIQSWDGNAGGGVGPDFWDFEVAGGPTLLHTTFNNGHPLTIGSGQAFPANYGSGTFAARTGASETDTLGYGMDAVYNLSFTFLYTGPSLQLNFRGSNLQEISDESWGLDDVQVVVDVPPVVPLFGETRVNVTTTGSQHTWPESPGAVAVDGAGNFVVTWSGQDGSGYYDVYARRFAPDGSPLTGEIRVNSYTPNEQAHSTVAVDGVGNFIVTWSSLNQDGQGWGVYAWRFAADGTPLSGEIPVNTTTVGDQHWSTVAADGDGNFFITWSSNGQDGSNNGVYARPFAADGTPLSGEIPVNTTTFSNQDNSRVAVDGTGNFIVTWSSFGQDGSAWGVFARRFAADGTPLSGEIPVNTTTLDSQLHSTVAVDGAGNFIVTWSSFGQDGSAWGVYARRFAADGTPLSNEIPVNTSTVGEQHYSAVAVDGAGNFIVTWSSFGQDGSAWGVYARRFAFDGTPLSSEILVNTTTASDQVCSSVAMNETGNIVVVWSSFNQDGSDWGVYARGFSVPAPTNEPATIGGVTSGNVVEDVTLTASGALTVTDVDSGEESFQAGDGDTTYGSFEIEVDGLWTYTLDNTHAEVQALPDGRTLSDSFTVQSFDGTEQIISITITGTNDAPVLDFLGNRIVTEGTPISFSVAASDVDNDTLTFTLENAPTGAAIDPTSGLFTWTPSEVQGPGIHAVTVSVLDNGNPAESDSQVFHVRVDEACLGFVQGWGANTFGQATVPASLANGGISRGRGRP